MTYAGRGISMFIYVVKMGESLFSIAAKYQVTMDSIRIANGLRMDGLVPGQDLIIPSNVYTVQPGDSLYLISQMSFIPTETIRLINGLESDALTVGMELYLPPREKYEATNLSYLTATTQANDQRLIQEFAPINTYLGIFEHHVFWEGNLSSLNAVQMTQEARANHVAPLAVITNLTATGFSPELVSHILNTPEVSERLITNIYNLLRNNNYAGVNIDFEGVPETDRDLFSAFLNTLRGRLQPEGYLTTVAVPAKMDDSLPWLRGYDYGGIGSAVDLVFIMAYDWHEAGSAPGPVAPISNVRKTIEYALNHMNRNKIILGVHNYGYDWTMSNGAVTNARAMSVSEAVETALRYQVPIQYSTEYQQPHFEYWDEAGMHIVWFENPRSRAIKLQLVVDYRLGGIGEWQLALPFPQSPALVDYFLITKKVV